MFRPYKAIIRHHIIEDFYPTAHFLKSSFHVACYYLSIFYLVARPFSVYIGALLYVSCALRFRLHCNVILGTTVTNQNLIQEEIKRRLNLGNACYHSVSSAV
jgi:hypothetical protein